MLRFMQTERECAAPASSDRVTPEGIGRRALVGGLVAAAGAAAAAIAKAGPLDPPAGPVSSTGKPISEIEPRMAVNSQNTPGEGGFLYVISRPGSYYLTGSIDVPDRSGIRITSSGVRLDLNGFCIRGGADNQYLGIADFGASLPDVTVRNGTVVGMGHGILLSNARNAIIEDMVVRDCKGLGVSVGASARIARVVCDTIGLDGISAGANAEIVSCTARGCRSVGIRVLSNSIVEACIATNNTGGGIRADVSGCVVRACIAAGNGAFGIQEASAVTACVASANAQRGISSKGASINGCAARGNGGSGFYAENGALSECTASLSLSETLVAHGFELGRRCAVVGSVSYANQGTGIEGGESCRIEGCVSRRQSLDGIELPPSASQSLILDNVCSDNGQAGPNTAGIHIQSSKCRVEGNLCALGHGYGVWITGVGMKLTGNVCAGNRTNWSIAKSNVYGAIMDRTNPSTPGMAGDGTAPSTLDTVDPFANFSL